MNLRRRRRDCIDRKCGKTWRALASRRTISPELVPYGGNCGLETYLAQGRQPIPLNTDDRLITEFASPRSMFYRRTAPRFADEDQLRQPRLDDLEPLVRLETGVADRQGSSDVTSTTGGWLRGTSRTMTAPRLIHRKLRAMLISSHAAPLPPRCSPGPGPVPLHRFDRFMRHAEDDAGGLILGDRPGAGLMHLRMPLAPSSPMPVMMTPNALRTGVPGSGSEKHVHRRPVAADQRASRTST